MKGTNAKYRTRVGRGGAIQQSVLRLTQGQLTVARKKMSPFDPTPVAVALLQIQGVLPDFDWSDRKMHNADSRESHG